MRTSSGSEVMGMNSLFRLLFPLLCAGILFLGCGPEELNQRINPDNPLRTSLSGSIFNLDSQNFSRDAEVIIQPGDYKVHSDAFGRFLIPEINPGQYMVSVRSGLYLTSVEITVPETTIAQIELWFGRSERGAHTIFFQEGPVWLEMQSQDPTQHVTPLPNLGSFAQIQDVLPHPFLPDIILFSGRLNPLDRMDLYKADLKSDCLNCVVRIYADTATNFDSSQPNLSPDGRVLVFLQNQTMMKAPMSDAIQAVSPLIDQNRLPWMRVDASSQPLAVLERDRLNELVNSGILNPAPAKNLTEPAECPGLVSYLDWHPKENMIAFLASPQDTQAPTRSVICSNLSTVAQIFILSVVESATASAARQITRDQLVKSNLRFNPTGFGLFTGLENLTVNPSEHYLMEIPPIYNGNVYYIVLGPRATSYDYDISLDQKRILYIENQATPGGSFPQIMEASLVYGNVVQPRAVTNYRYTANIRSPRFLGFWPRTFRAQN